MDTAFLLLAFYQGKAVIPIADVCRDWFPHLSPEKLLKKAAAGEIPLNVLRIEPSQKAARGVHLQDMADYIDRQRASASKDFTKLHG
jgi:hypothetical protein